MILIIFLTMTSSLNFITAHDDEKENEFEEESKINQKLKSTGKLNPASEIKSIQISDYAKFIFNRITDNEALTISILLLALFCGLIIKYKRT